MNGGFGIELLQRDYGDFFAQPAILLLLLLLACDTSCEEEYVDAEASHVRSGYQSGGKVVMC